MLSSLPLSKCSNVCLKLNVQHFLAVFSGKNRGKCVSLALLKAEALFGWSVLRYTLKQLYNSLPEEKKILNSDLSE